jgi:branched-chain amino acid transport system ATP-binding protein
MSVSERPDAEPRAGVAALRAEDLAAGFGRRPYIHDISFALPAGKVLAVLGANGAGKTTLIMTLGGAVRPSAGTVWRHGVALTGTLSQRVRDGFGVITQERMVIPTLTVRDNLRLGQGTVDAAVEIFPELRDHLRRPAGLLSGGQQQMLSVGRALASQPSILLADELSFGLAPLVVERLLTAISEGASSWNMSVVLVEQHLGSALRHSDFGCVLRRGELALFDSSKALIDRKQEVLDLYI